MKNNENVERDLMQIEDDFEEMGVLESFGVFFQKVRGILLIAILFIVIYNFIRIESVLNLQLSKRDYQLEQRILYQRLDDLSMKVESLEKNWDLLMKKIKEKDLISDEIKEWQRIEDEAQF